MYRNLVWTHDRYNMMVGNYPQTGGKDIDKIA